MMGQCPPVLTAGRDWLRFMNYLSHDMHCIMSSARTHILYVVHAKGLFSEAVSLFTSLITNTTLA